MIRRTVPAIVVAVVANVAMLAAAAANRRGQPDALVRLTERELAPGYESDRNSAKELRLIATSGEGTQDWLTQSRLSSLGFDCRVPPADAAAPRFYSRQLPRRVYGVFEFDGPAWRQWQDKIERRRAELRARPDVLELRLQIEGIERELVQSSRLVVVDAGLDAAALRRDHPDRGRYLILPAEARIHLRTLAAPPGPMPALAGSIQPAITTVVVPLHERPLIDRLMAERDGEPTARPPRYAVMLAVGRRYEPWIVSVDSIDTSSPGH